MTKKNLFKNKIIFITGGTGSFGKAAISQLLKYPIKKLIIFSRDELKQFELSTKYKNEKRLRFFLGDIRDQERLETAMNGVDFCIHAAALKQVPSGEYNPFEVIKTNVMGAKNIIQSSIKNKVKKIVALSTDKAVHPINLYGASKLASDKLFVAANNTAGNTKSVFSVVRYGNVIGSRGSVVETFKENLKNNSGFFQITDKRMTRFWIKLEQGVDFVLNSFLRMHGGEIFVPKLPTIKIVDLAKALNKDYKIKIIGIRPGEKLHEIMCPREEALNILEFKNFYIIKPSIQFRKKFNYKITKLKESGKRVSEDFEYNSMDNTDYLKNREIKAFV